MHHPGIEPEAHAWKACMLHYTNDAIFLRMNIINNVFIFISFFKKNSYILF